MCMVELYPWDILLDAVELVSWSHYWGYNYGRLLLCSAIFFELLLLHQYVALSPTLSYGLADLLVFIVVILLSNFHSFIMLL